MPIRVAILSAVVLLAAAISARAEGPGAVYKDLERYGDAPPMIEPRRHGPSKRLGRPVTGSPGYVGSDYGLGKPAFTGLGSRPDWGGGDE
jgi:hypothetical protein